MKSNLKQRPAGIALGIWFALTVCTNLFADRAANLWLYQVVNSQYVFEQINPSSGAIVQTVKTGQGTIVNGGDLAYGGGYLWLYQVVNSQYVFEQINPSSGAIVQTVKTGQGTIVNGGDLAYGGGYLWLYQVVNSQYVFEQINPSSGAIVQTIRAGQGTIVNGGKLAYGGGYLWLYQVVNSQYVFEQINPSSGAIVQTIKAGQGTIVNGGELGYGGGYLWLYQVVNSEYVFEQINPSSGAIVQTTKAGQGTIVNGGLFTVEEQWNVSTSSSPSAGGTTSGSGFYDDGSAVTVTATPGSCYSFANWTKSGSAVSSSAGYSFTVTSDSTLAANFTSVTYVISTSASPVEGGTTSGGGTVDCGSTVTVAATANSCYSFTDWTENGTVVSTSPSYSFSPSSALMVTANFTPIMYLLTTSNEPPGAGTTSGGGSISCGSTVQIKAAANPGFIFTGWSGTGPDSYTGTNNPAIVTMDGAISEIANFAANTNTSYALGISNLVEGPTAGTDTVVLSVSPETGVWTAITNAGWLHLSIQNQSGIGSTNVLFSYDANPGGTRTGELTIGGLSLFVTQAGSNYVASPGPATILVSSGLSGPKGIALDTFGNVYIADTGSSAIRKWTKTNNALSTLVSSNSISTLNAPQGITVDAAGNVYIADTGDAAVKEWVAETGNLTTLPIAGLNSPSGLAMDAAGDVYIADTGNGTIVEWLPGTNEAKSLVSDSLGRGGIAVDRAGNVYYSTGYIHGIMVLTEVNEWNVATSNETMLVSGMNFAAGVAVDGAGNAYVAYTGRDEILEVPAASRNGLPVVTGLNFGAAVAVDGAENIYIADTDNNAIKELPHAFVDPTPKLEGLAAGDDSLPTVLPPSANLLAPFAPTSDQSWLNITGDTNGVVYFSFTANTGPARTAHILLLGQSIPVTQGVVGTPPLLGTVPSPGNDVVLFAFSNVPSASFSVLSTTNLFLPLSEWTVAGTPTENPPGQYHFTVAQVTNSPTFYTVRSP